MPLTQVQSGLLESGAALNNIGAGNITPSFLSTQSQYTGFKNRIINGAMMIDQRNAGASVSTNVGTQNFCVDRWQGFYSTTNKYTMQQNAGNLTGTNLPSGFRNYLGVTSSAATSLGASDYYLLNQRIEGFNVADLNWGTANAQTVTLSFWVRSSLTGTFGGSINPTGDARSYVFSYTISAANTWEYKTVTIPGDTTGTWNTTNLVGMAIYWGLGVGSSLSTTAGSWVSGSFYAPTGATSVVGTNGATFYITGVQLERGSTATSWDARPYGTELALCQRYFELCSGSIRSAGTGNFNGTHLSFKSTKRSTPTMVYLANGPVFSNNSFSGFVTQDTNSAGIQFNATAGGEQYNYGFTASASAEL